MPYLAKDGRRISKIIKEEGKTGKQALDISINELEELQKFQRNAVKVLFLFFSFISLYILTHHTRVKLVRMPIIAKLTWLLRK